MSRISKILSYQSKASIALDLTDSWIIEQAWYSLVVRPTPILRFYWWRVLIYNDIVWFRDFVIKITINKKNFSIGSSFISDHNSRIVTSTSSKSLCIYTSSDSLENFDSLMSYRLPDLLKVLCSLICVCIVLSLVSWDSSQYINSCQLYQLILGLVCPASFL